MSHQKTVSSSESYWTQSVSGLLQPRNESTSFSQLAPCFYHEWINLRILAKSWWGCCPFWICSFRGCSCGCGHSGCSSSGLGPLRFRSSCAVVFGDPPGSFLVVGPRAARARQLARAGVSPARLVVRLFGWALVSILFWVPSGPWTCQCFGSFGEGGRCQSTCSQPHYFTVACLIFLFSTIPMLLGQRLFSNHGMGGRRMLFIPMRCFLQFCKKLRSSLGSGSSGGGSRRFGGSASGQGSVEPASGSLTASGSIKASSSYWRLSSDL